MKLVIESPHPISIYLAALILLTSSGTSLKWHTTHTRTAQWQNHDQPGRHREWVIGSWFRHWPALPLLLYIYQVDTVSLGADHSLRSGCLSDVEQIAWTHLYSGNGCALTSGESHRRIMGRSWRGSFVSTVYRFNGRNSAPSIDWPWWIGRRLSLSISIKRSLNEWSGDLLTS